MSRYPGLKRLADHAGRQSRTYPNADTIARKAGALRVYYKPGDDTPRLGPDIRVSIPGLADDPTKDDGKAVDLKNFKDTRDALSGRIDNKANQGAVDDLQNKIANKTTSADVNNILHNKLKKSAFK